MLSKNIAPMCQYCEHGKPLPRKQAVLCRKYGPVDNSYKCRSFKYDPIKRVPLVRPALEKYDKEDFTI